MAIKKYKPTTPGRRGMTTIDYNKVLAAKAKRSLLAPRKSPCRNVQDVSLPDIKVEVIKAYRIIDLNVTRTMFLQSR